MYELAKNQTVQQKVYEEIALHYDPLYYNQPEFGQGARQCIGLGLAKLGVKLVIVLISRKFRFDLGDEHKNKELKMNPRSRVVTAPLNGINLKVSSR